MTDTDLPILHKRAEKLCLTDEQQRELGYPHSFESGRVIIPRISKWKKEEIPSASERHCSRCYRIIRITKDGKVISSEKCSHHPISTPRGQDWKCCNKPYSARGCDVYPRHVHKGNLITDENGYAFFETPSPAKEPTMFAVDAEMVYTTVGMEATHISLIDTDGRVAYKSVIKPENEITDYNTKFSGMTAADFIKKFKSLKEVHRDLKDIIFSDTILMGHGLASDFKALKICHPKVIDTSVIYEHLEDPKKTPSLKSLAEHHLERSIQQGHGHDSTEDAKAVMDLVLLKVSSEKFSD